MINKISKIYLTGGLMVAAVLFMGLQCPSGRPDNEPDIRSFDSVVYEPGMMTVNWTYNANGTTQDYRFWPFVVLQKEINGVWSDNVSGEVTLLPGTVTGGDINWTGMGFRGDEPPLVSCVVDAGQTAYAPVYDNCNCSPWGNDNNNHLGGCIQNAQPLKLPMYLTDGKYRIKLGVGFDDINDDNVADNTGGCTGHDDDRDNAASVGDQWITFGVGIIEGEAYSCDITVENEIQPFSTYGKCLCENGNPKAVELWWDESRRADFYTLKRKDGTLVSPVNITERHYLDIDTIKISQVNDYIVEAYRKLVDGSFVPIEDSTVKVPCACTEPTPAGKVTVQDSCPTCGDPQINFRITADIVQCPAAGF